MSGRASSSSRPGCPEGSMDPEHYDLTYEMIRYGRFQVSVCRF